MTDSERPVLSVGHSTHAVEHLVGILAEQGIEVLVDVRSTPYSRWAPQFDREALKDSVSSAEIRYLYLGDELGGRPKGRQFYDQEGHVLYSEVALSPLFLSGIERLVDGWRRFRIAVMCSEEDPVSCHRRLLIGRVLRARGIEMVHLRGDGSVQSEQTLKETEPSRQPNLFEDMEDRSWRSTRSVSRSGPRSSSSAH